MAKQRRYTVELEAAAIGQTISDELLDRFASALFAEKRIAAAAPAAEAATLELRASVDANSPADALAIAEVAFIRAAQKAGLAVEVTEACVWLDSAAADDAGENARRRETA